jgi:hypothetical protein
VQVRGRWWQPCPSLVTSHVHVRRRAIGRHRLADQVISSAQNKVITIALPFLKESTLRGTSLPKLSFSCSWRELSLETSYKTVHWENMIPYLPPGEVLQRYFRALTDLSAFTKKHQQAFLASLPGSGCHSFFEPSSPMYLLFYPFFSFYIFSNGATHNRKPFCS